MAIAGATTLLSLVAIATLLGSVWLWLITLARIAIGGGWLPASAQARLAVWLSAAGYPPNLPLVPWRARRAVPWAFVDLLLLVGIWILATLAVQTVFRQLGWSVGPAKIEDLSLFQRKAVIIGNIVVLLSIIGIGLPLIALRTSATLADLGWSWHTIWADLRLGVIGFVMLAPPVYALQGLLVTIWKPSKHPLMEMFKGTPDASFFLVLVVSAAVAAPLFEEFVFRVLIQGFLEKWLSLSSTLQELLVGGQQQPRDKPAASQRVTPDFAVDPISWETAVATNPYAAPLAPHALNQNFQSAEEQPELRGWAAWTPIAISSAIFALLHYSHGPDWIPLLFLAAGMGYLYQRTHRLLPSLTVHALLNGFSMCALWVQVSSPQ